MALFLTGMNPGKLGFFDFMQRDNDYKLKPFDSSVIKGKTILDILSKSNYGFKVGSINVPSTYPPHPINGFIISGIDTPSDECDYTYS